MKCQFCQNNKASVDVKQVINGVVKEFSVCSSCAEKAGINSPLSITDFLFGMDLSPLSQARENMDDRICDGCGMRSSDFNETSRLGCEQCYDTFAEELAPILEDMHKGTEHVGKVPKSEKTRADVRSLSRKLERAVDEQEFEFAAELRDQIAEIKALIGEESHGR